MWEHNPRNENCTGAKYKICAEHGEDGAREPESPVGRIWIDEREKYRSTGSN